MAINRLSRDDILNRALDRADSPTLDQKDRPSSPTIAAGALSLQFLQEGLDYFHKLWPFSADITSVAVSIAENDTTITVPSDFILDYKNGIILDDDAGRLRRKSLSKILGVPVGSSSSPNRGTPAWYAIRGTTIEFRPKANKAFTGNLWYYKLPALLTSNDVPVFPDDHILVEWVFLKAQEWHHVIPSGTALAFANKVIGDLQKSGLMNESEEQQIELDPDIFGEQGVSGRNTWMGRTAT